MLLGNGLYAVSQWGILAAFNKLGNEEAAGQFLLAYALVLPLSSLLNFNFRIVYVTDAAADTRFGYFIGSRIICNVALVLICSVVGSFFANGVVATYLTVLSMSLAAGIQSHSDLFSGYFQKRHRLDIAAKLNVIKAILNFAVVVFAFYLTRDVVIAVVSLAVSRFISYRVFDIPAANMLETGQFRCRISAPFIARFSWGALRGLTWIGLPLGLNGVVSTLSPQIPRLVLANAEGLEAVGIFGSIAQVVVAGSLVVNALGAALVPRLTKAIGEGKSDEFWSVSVRVLGFAFILGMMGVLIAHFFGAPILVLLYTPSYGEFSPVLTLCMVSATLAYVGGLATMILAAMKAFRLILFASAIQCVSTLGFSLLLVSPYGSYGAAVSLVIANLVQVVLVLLFLPLAARQVIWGS